ncbi:MAG TPA: hypothetical protein VMZ30_15570, partial [Pyrinomonadaceae bacterium]|nr:hypothetical protein [Pyrinomonadaceae bacterium]
DFRMRTADCGNEPHAASVVESVGRTRKAGAAMSQIATSASDIFSRCDAATRERVPWVLLLRILKSNKGTL